jgi:uncharacterized BrkB/YihY/UPF0761 family membrane protein
MATPKEHASIVSEVKPLQAFITKSVNDWVPNLAGIFAYNLVMLMVPIALALLTILSIVGQSSFHATVIHGITSFFPGLANQQNALNLATTQLGQASGILVVLTVLSGFFFGSLLFVVIEACLDIIYRVRPRPLLRQFLVAIAMFVLFIILIPVMVFASAAPGILFSSLASLPLLKGIPGSSFILLGLGGIVGSFLATFLLFEVVYLVVPNQRISWRNSWCGAIVAATASEIFLILFPFIVRLFFQTYAGPVGFAVILLLFLYIFAIIFLLGAEVNAFFFEGVRPLPNDLVTFLSTMAGKLNNDAPADEAPVHVDTQPTDRADAAHVAEAKEQER